MIRARGTPVFGSRSFCASAKYETVLPSAFRRWLSRRYMPPHDYRQLQPPQAITAETCAYTISTLTPPSPTDLQGKRLPSPVQMPTNCGTPVCDRGRPRSGLFSASVGRLLEAGHVVLRDYVRVARTQPALAGRV